MGRTVSSIISSIDARFVLSAASAKDFPATRLPEIAAVGRSNVGKSSLINALVKRKIARTSAAPGKTRLANYYLIDEAFYLVDLPGYGYARGGHEAKEIFDDLIHQYFGNTQGRTIGGVLHVIDSRHPELDQDQAASRWLSQTGLRIAIIASKVDKLSASEQSRTVRSLTEHYDWPVLTESVLKGTGLDAILKLVRGWAANPLNLDA